MADFQPTAALTSLPNSGSASNYIVWYNDSATNQLMAYTFPYSQLKTPPGPRQVASKAKVKEDDGFGPTDVPSGNIPNKSALAVATFNGTMNVYGILNGNTKGTSLVCRLSPAFDLLNVGDAPITSNFSLAACSDGKSTGELFFIGWADAKDIGLYYLTLPGDSSSTFPTQIPLSPDLNPQSYLGAAYGVLGDLSAMGYCVAQDNKGVLQCYSDDGSVQKTINGGLQALAQTPIACLFLGTALIVYYFNPVPTGSTSGSPLMRAILTSNDGNFSVGPVTAHAPNGFTQLTAFLDPSMTTEPGDGGGGSGTTGTAIISYMELNSNILVSVSNDIILP